VDRAVELVKEKGAKRAIKLSVSAPFHCALMMPAQERLAVDLGKVHFEDLSVPLMTNVDARMIETGSEARESLIRQVSSPVRWQQSVENMIASGVHTFVEVGPGKVLSGLVRQISRNVRNLNVEDSTTLEQVLGLGV
jgi:[acyl-carrier-protein] S-malonyltransferase